MDNVYIEFKKQRDFGQILGDTFSFFRMEFKPFMSVFFHICGPFLLALLLAIAFYTYIAGDLATFDPFNDEPLLFTNPFLFISSFLMYLICGVLAYIVTVGTTLFYISSYINNAGSVDVNDIKSKVYGAFWSLFGMSILKGFTVFFAALLCFFPVLYVMIPMAIVFSIYVFEPRKSVTEAYSDSFYLVNSDFWLAFGSFIVLGIIYYILSMVFSLPAVIYSFIKIGITASEIDPANMTDFADPFYIFLNVLASFIQFILNIILIIGGAFIYFHLNEKKNFTGTFERIDKIGEKTEQ
jgi:hypothetical protein